MTNYRHNTAVGAALRFILAVLVLGVATGVTAQSSPPDVQTYFRQYVGLTGDEIATIRRGQPVAKALPSRTNELFIFGAVYVNSRPENYVRLAHDYDQLRRTGSFLALREFSNPPTAADLDGFALDASDIRSLRDCQPGDCAVQMPATYIEDLRRSFDWSSPNIGQQINDELRRTALERLLAYQRDGMRALGVYHDKKHPADVAEQFQSMLSYYSALPRYLPEFHQYLLNFPAARPEHATDSFYWAKVDFGMKPTLRVVHVITMQFGPATEPSFALAEKQLYASHYFRTALDLTFCISDGPRGFYLIRVMGSEQEGLTGFKGSIIRSAATRRSISSLQKSLGALKNRVEAMPEPGQAPR